MQMSMVVGSRLRGFISIALTTVVLGGCKGGAPSKPDGGPSGQDGGAAGTTGGSPDGGADSAGDVANGTAGSSAAGSSGSGGTAGAAGAGSAAAADGGADSGSAAGADGGVAGTDAGTAGAGGQVGAGCVKALFGRYLVRTDGELLYENDDGTQSPILNGVTGMPLGDVSSVQEAGSHGCAALGTSKTAWCWRANSSGNSAGQLGNGTPDPSGAVVRATQVLTAVNTPLANVTAIADGESGYDGSSNSCAVTAEGSLYCWGDLTWIVNEGTKLTSPYAVQITTDGLTPLAGVRQVAVTDGDACAVIKGASSREVWCWGQNFYGETGSGDVGVHHRYPIKVIGLSDPSKVILHGDIGCALDAGGVRCWGNNGNYDTGTGSMDGEVLTPSNVNLMSGTPLSMITDIHGGESFSYGSFCGLVGSKGILLCWGGSFAGNYARASGLTNVSLLGGVDVGADSIRYVTSDGVFHLGNYTRAPNCGPL
jgi:hypothetical protein